MLRTPRGDLSYCAILEEASRIARRLSALGCSGGDRVVIASTDHRVIVPAILGTLQAGCAFAPVAGGVRPDSALMATLGAAAVIDEAGRVAATHDSATRGTHDRRDLAATVRTHDRPDLARSVSNERRCVVSTMASTAGDLASIYATSGSTGKPRLIAGRRSGIDHHLEWEIDYLGIDACARGTVLHAPSYDAYLPDVFVPLRAGGEALVPPSKDPVELAAWIANERITLIHCVPSLFREVLPHLRSEHVRAVLFAGEVVRASDVRAARAAVPNARLINLYGPSEATLVKLHHEIVDADLERASIPIGVPMSGVTVTLVDGEIAIRSPYGALGYLDDPEATRAKFIDHGDGTTTYLTGDLGRFEDGLYFFEGRRDRQIKLLGARVDLDEVEAIIGACTGVREVAVVATETALHGFVVTDEDIAAVRRDVMSRLTPAMRLAWLTRVDAMPRTTSGKIDRHRLAERT